jgi:hypothetical protein
MMKAHARRASFLPYPIMAVLILAPTLLWARPTIRTSFFNVYPELYNTRLRVLPSNADHCGACHFDFNGAGLKNGYGTRIGALLSSYPNTDAGRQQLIRAIENEDSDTDGQTTLTELRDLTHFGNTPTFPGLQTGNVGQAVNVSQADLAPYLTPTTAVDTTPPTVAVTVPNGGESWSANQTHAIQWSASDASGIAAVNIFFSDTGGTSWKPLARGLANSGSWSWYLPNRPGGATRIRVQAIDGAGNTGQDESNSGFTIVGLPAGVVPTTLRDLDLPGTQPLEGAVLADVDASCTSCHANYSATVEPYANWRGSMMGQAARDPLFFACVAVAEQDAPSVGDLCIRCHSPGGWQEGRSTDTSGGQLTAKDRQGVQCDFCHRLVDRNYVVGNPPEDPAVLATVNPLPLQYANGQFINDPGSLKRGPFADIIEQGHLIRQSPLHPAGNLCGTCHDVSNPAFERVSPGDYAPGSFNAPHSTLNLRDMFPVERTFSEWSQSTYATAGVYAPQFAGNKPGGIVSTCQDCHMRDVTGKGANVATAPVRDNLPLHDLTGGNAFIGDLLPAMFPGEVDVAQLQAAKARAVSMLQLAATLELIPDGYGVDVKVTNETAHKLPSGYPEGRRIWLNVRAKDAGGNQVFESGAYDPATGVLTHDAQAKIYEIHLGMSPALAAAVGMPAGPGFHFVLNDTVYHDNRIPPRGFTNAGFAAVQSPPVGHAYEDGQYWDVTSYALPATADSVVVRLYYQTLSKEYVEFLRDANHTNGSGQALYDAWAANGRSAPILMAQARAALHVLTGVGDQPEGAVFAYALKSPQPNPSPGRTSVQFALAHPGRVTVAVYDTRGRRVRLLVDEVREPGRYETAWDGRGPSGQPLPSGVYFCRMEAGQFCDTKRMTLVK